MSEHLEMKKMTPQGRPRRVEQGALVVKVAQPAHDAPLPLGGRGRGEGSPIGGGSRIALSRLRHPLPEAEGLVGSFRINKRSTSVFRFNPALHGA